jgi:hypothetical protein
MHSQCVIMLNFAPLLLLLLLLVSLAIPAGGGA